MEIRAILILILTFILHSCNSNTNQESTSYDYQENQQLNAMMEEIMEKSKDMKKVKERQQRLNKMFEDFRFRNVAIISDKDGYTNLRKGRGTDYRVAARIYENETFRVIPSSNSNWWKVKTQDGTEGYIYHDRVKLIATYRKKTCKTHYYRGT